MVSIDPDLVAGCGRWHGLQRALHYISQEEGWPPDNFWGAVHCWHEGSVQKFLDLQAVEALMSSMLLCHGAPTLLWRVVQTAAKKQHVITAFTGSKRKWMSHPSSQSANLASGNLRRVGCIRVLRIDIVYPQQSNPNQWLEHLTNALQAHFMEISEWSHVTSIGVSVWCSLGRDKGQQPMPAGAENPI